MWSASIECRPMSHDTGLSAVEKVPLNKSSTSNHCQVPPLAKARALDVCVGHSSV